MKLKILSAMIALLKMSRRIQILTKITFAIIPTKITIILAASLAFAAMKKISLCLLDALRDVSLNSSTHKNCKDLFFNKK